MHSSPCCPNMLFAQLSGTTPEETHLVLKCPFPPVQSNMWVHCLWDCCKKAWVGCKCNGHTQWEGQRWFAHKIMFKSARKRTDHYAYKMCINAVCLCSKGRRTHKCVMWKVHTSVTCMCGCFTWFFFNQMWISEAASRRSPKPWRTTPSCLHRTHCCLRHSLTGTRQHFCTSRGESN